MLNPLVLLHGYSDTSKGFQKWRDALIKNKQLDQNKVHLIDYVRLANEISIRDIGEAFDRALVYEAGIAENDPFGAIAHFTGTKDCLNPQEGKLHLLMPYTTTFFEFIVNRDPLLEEDKGKILQVVKQEIL